MTTTISPPFGKWRLLLWPIRAYEFGKILPLLVLSFCLSGPIFLLRDVNDQLLLSLGVEQRSFLQLYGYIPSALLCTLIYFKLSNIISREKLFYSIIASFLTFFAVFAVFLYPNLQSMQLDGIAAWLNPHLSAMKMSGGAECLRLWPLTLFSIGARMWTPIVVSFSFWSFANDTTTVKEAKRWYPLLRMAPGVLLASLAYNCSTFWHDASSATYEMPNFLIPYCIFWVEAAGIAAMAIYWWMNRSVLKDARFLDAKTLQERTKHFATPAWKSLVSVTKSSYILSIGLIVFCSSASLELLQFFWKDALRLFYPQGIDYSHFMGNFSILTSIVTLVAVLFVAANAMRKSWGFAAMLPPISLLVLGLAFFGLAAFSADSLTPCQNLTLVLGTVGVLFGHVFLTSLVYPTKEIAFIPLDAEFRFKAQAFVAIFVTQVANTAVPLIQRLSKPPVVILVFASLIVVWIAAVRVASRHFEQMKDPSDI
jgi:ATP:ADP antiporter, AAA family